MANCPECGKPLPEGYKICPACGGSVAHLKDEIITHINLLRKKIEKEPANRKLHMDLGNIYQTNGLFIEARDEFQQATASEPHDFDAHFKLAQVYMKLRQGDKAEKEFNAALHINPKSTAVLTGLFRSYFLEGKTDPAIVLGEKVLRTNPDNVEFHKLLKELYQKKGDQDMALNELLTLSALIPEDLPVIREITVHYLAKKDFEKAAVYYGRMMNMAADEPALGIQIGEYYFDHNQPDRAIEFMASLIDRSDLDPDMSATVRVRLALAYLDRGALPEALKIADGIRHIDPGVMKPEIRKMLGMFYTRVGQADLVDKHSGKAAAHFEAAVHYDFDNAEAGPTLEKIRKEADVSRVQTMKKAGIIAAGAVAVVLLLILARTTTRGRIVLQIDPAVAVTLSIDGRVVKGAAGKEGSLVSPVLPIGKHNVVVESEGYEKWTGLVNIGLAKNARRSVSLVPINYALRVVSLPDSSDVMVNDRLVGKTPYAADRLPVRRNTVSIVHEYYAPWCTTFTPAKGESIDLDTVILKNLSGKWIGKIGKEAYAYDAGYRMTVDQKDGDLTVDYYHKPVEGFTYSGKIKGIINQGEVIIQGELVYKYYDVFRWEKIKRKIVLKGKISDDWDRIEGNSQVDGLGDQTWWAERVK